MSLAQTQFEMMAAVCDVHRPVPFFIEAGKDEERRTVRFNIYRNNYYVAVINVLRERFPVVERLVGEEFFQAVVRQFVQAELPLGQSNLNYGQTFPTFLKHFEPVDDVPYLPDIGCLEWARFRSAIAPNSTTATLNDYSSIAPDFAALIRFDLHPALNCITSEFPIYDIWRTNHEDEIVQPVTEMDEDQSVLVTRSAKGVETHRLPNCGAAIIQALADGATLGDAFETSQVSQENFAATLSLLVVSGGVRRIVHPEHVAKHSAA